MRTSAALATTAAVGVAASGMLTIVSGASAGDGTAMVAAAVAGATPVGLSGLWVLRRLRRRPVGVQAAAVALVAVIAVAAGAALAARLMFVSSHDLGALGVVLVAAATVGVAAALLLGARIGAEARTIGDLARRLGADSPTPGAVDGVASAELSALADRLAETEQRLAASRDRERAVEATRRELVAWVSHDLRTPLAGIRAVVEALRDGVVTDPATVEDYFQMLVDDTDRLSALVDDLFELSRIQAGALRLTMDTVSLGDLVSDAVAGAQPSAARKGVEVRGQLDGPPPMLAVSSPEMLRVLRNLLDNAIRHTPPDGVVTVRAGGDDERAWVAVSDECGGIPVGELDRVFEPSFRGDAARSPGDGGAGLGLAIARGLVDAHDGALAVANTDVGCRFEITLPLEADVTPTG